MREEARRAGRELGRQRYVGLSREDLQRERARVWEEALVAFAAKAQLDLRALPKRASDPLKLLVASALKQTTSVSNCWLAEWLKLGSVNSVGPWLQRWRQEPSYGKSLARLLSHVRP